MEGEKQFQSETRSEEDIDESDSEGFFDKAKDFFSDIFSSDTDEEEGDVEEDNGTALKRVTSLEGGKTDSGIASLAQPTSVSVASSSNASRGISGLNVVCVCVVIFICSGTHISLFLF